MPIKIIILIITACCTACGLVVIRQERINTAHNLASLHSQLRIHQREVQTLRVQLQNNLDPENIRLLVTRYEQNTGSTMVPFRREECILSCQPLSRWASIGSTNNTKNQPVNQ